VIGDEWRIDVVGQPTEGVEIRRVERRGSEQIQPDPVQHDGIAGAHAREPLPRRARGVEEVLADDLETRDRRFTRGLVCRRFYLPRTASDARP